MFIKLKDKDAGLSAEVKVAKMSMIDLAGSEKVKISVINKFSYSNISHIPGCCNWKQGRKIS